MEHVVHQLQAFLAVQHLCHDAQSAEVVQNIRLNMDQPRLCLLHGFRFNTEGQVLGLGQAVVALRQLRAEHLAVFLTDIVESVVLQRDPDAFLKICRISTQIHKRQLKVHGAVEEVQETAPFIKDGCLILLLGKLIIDVLKLNCLGIIV